MLKFNHMFWLEKDGVMVYGWEIWKVQSRRWHSLFYLEFIFVGNCHVTFSFCKYASLYIITMFYILQRQYRKYIPQKTKDISNKNEFCFSVLINPDLLSPFPEVPAILAWLHIVNLITWYYSVFMLLHINSIILCISYHNLLFLVNHICWYPSTLFQVVQIYYA